MNEKSLFIILIVSFLLFSPSLYADKYNINDGYGVDVNVTAEQLSIDVGYQPI